MDPIFDTPSAGAPRARLGWLRVTLFLLLTVVLTTIASVWIIKTYVFPTRFEPVTLNAKEQQVLNAKLERFERLGTGRRGESSKALTPQRYSEANAKREISLTERELNALLAKNTDLAEKLAIDLSDDLISAKLLVRVDDDFPVMGGQTVKVNAGVEVAYAEGRPIVVLKGISIMGVPLPNAWVGGMKNVDLVREYGGDKGFWQAFASGVEDIRVEEGKLKIKLKE